MVVKTKIQAQNPLLLRCHRLIEAFGKSDDERDFYLDRHEGFIVYVDLDKPQHEIALMEAEIEKHSDRYVLIPKLTFYETKKIMEGFVTEKVYDIDTKEKLLDVIQSKEARENFLEFIYDHHSELEKWHLYYQERSRIRIIEWLRNNHFHFVFEEDLELPKSMMEKLKRSLFQSKVGKDIQSARKVLFAKAKTYYSNEALNPRPKRGRPPKQTTKLEIEPQVATDIYTTVSAPLRPFLFIPDISSASSVTFSSKYENEEALLAGRKHAHHEADMTLESINQKLTMLRNLSTKWVEPEDAAKAAPRKNVVEDDFNIEVDDEDDDLPRLNGKSMTKPKATSRLPATKPPKKPLKRSIIPPKTPTKKKPPQPPKKGAVKRIMPKPAKKTAAAPVPQKKISQKNQPEKAAAKGAVKKGPVLKTKKTLVKKKVAVHTKPAKRHSIKPVAKAKPAAKKIVTQHFKKKPQPRSKAKRM